MAPYSALRANATGTTRLVCMVSLALMLPRPSHSQIGEFQTNWRLHQELTYKDTIDRLALTPREKALLREAITDVYRRLYQRNLILPADLNQFVAATRVRAVHLSSGQVPEIIAQAGDKTNCGATGNCNLWIFKQADKRFQPILETEGQTFEIRQTATKHFKDFLVGIHESASERTLLLYRMGDGKYRMDACYDAVWPWSEPPRQKPLITRCKEANR